MFTLVPRANGRLVRWDLKGLVVKVAQRFLRVSSSLMVASVLAFGAGAALADRGDHDGRDRDHGGFGSHPTLPVPSVLIFGGIAIAASIVAASRRRSKKDEQSKADNESAGDSK
jgi:hypothetical protein